MKFTVTWSAEAENELCDLWLAANDRTEFSRQVAAIENDLRTSADELGEARADETRILICGLIGVLFDVDVGDRMAHILHIQSKPPLRPKPR